MCLLVCYGSVTAFVQRGQLPRDDLRRWTYCHMCVKGMNELRCLYAMLFDIQINYLSMLKNRKTEGFNIDELPFWGEEAVIDNHSSTINQSNPSNP